MYAFNCLSSLKVVLNRLQNVDDVSPPNKLRKLTVKSEPIEITNKKLNPLVYQQFNDFDIIKLILTTKFSEHLFQDF